MGYSFLEEGREGNLIYVSIHIYVSDKSATRPETDKAGQSPRGRSKSIYKRYIYKTISYVRNY